MSRLSGGFWNDSNSSRRRRNITNSNNNINNNDTSNYGGNNDKTLSSPSSSRRIDFFLLLKIILFSTTILYAIAVLRFRASTSSFSSLSPTKTIPQKEYCEFRKYPERRYYGLNKNDPRPDFLNTEYIYGELPQIVQLKTSEQQKQNKLCLDQTEWYPVKEEEEEKTATKESVRKGIQILPQTQQQRLPFADGTNPSILKLIDNPRIDPSIRDLFSSSFSSRNNSNRNDNDDEDNVPYYLLTICMTNSQCSWGEDSREEQIEYNLSTQKEPSTVRTVLLIVNKNFETISEATIKTKIDVLFGGRRNVRPVKPNNQLRMFALDDARLFTHNGQIWVSYREGKLFGYEKQVLNKLHFNITTSSSTISTKTKIVPISENSLTVTLLASETETLCCGRNMALIDNVKTDQLQALTWVDPVTVIEVDTKKTDGENNNKNGDNQKQRHLVANDQDATKKKLQQQEQKKKQNNNKKKKESHFHGTNGFMVHLSERNEYLGIGHFHRPPGREKNDYARFGHHYTHAFFTISDTSPFYLKRLSSELLLPSHAHTDDAEIIQFWSGLERIDVSTLVLAYGINDCEGVATYLDLAVVEDLLLDVPKGKEVVDFMMPLKDLTLKN